MVSFLPGGNKVAGQAESFIVAAIDVSDEFVDIRVVAFRRQLNRLVEWSAAGQQTAETEESAAT